MGDGRFVGASVARREDPRLLSGTGQFIADISLPAMLHVAYVRSEVAHARIRALDLSAARAAPGVIAVLSGADIAGILKPIPGMQNKPPKAWRDAVEHEINIPEQPILATDKVRYVGEPLAVVLAESLQQAEDAAELVEADLEHLPAVTTMDNAFATAARVHEHMTSNVICRFRVTKGDTEKVLASAPRKLSCRFDNHRYSAMPMECRGVIAHYERHMDSITIWSSTQVVHWVRREVSIRLGLPESRVRCIAPDVGGGFGVKGHVYPEDILVSYLSYRYGRPVRWIESRGDHMLHSTHSRDDRHDVEIGFDTDGRILALRDCFVKDSGAYTPVGIGTLSNTIAHLLGPYDVGHLDASTTMVVTNKAPNAPYRGAGRPEGAFVMERLVDLVAHDLGLDPVAVRLRNMITREQMPYNAGIPYRDGAPVVFDGGDYVTALNRAVEALGGLDAFRREQEKARKEGRYIGLGIGSYVEGTGAGPFEGATIRIDPSGGVYVATGAAAQGQGQATVLSQVAADAWGVRPEQVTMAIGDTAAIAIGFGTIASRSAVNSSAAIGLASRTLRQKVFAIAGHMLECAVEDLELGDGKVFVKGAPDLSLTLGQIAMAARPGWDSGRPPGVGAGLEATEYFEPPTVTWSYASHAGIVEIDPETGVILIRKYVVCHDAGVIINPRLADGQIMGGIVQGLGGGLFEEIIYDDQGQLLTGSFMDYAMPRAADMPSFEVLHQETPSPLNELGIKGLGEGGAIVPPVVIANAVCDALRPIGFEIYATPLRRWDIVKAIRDSEERKQ